MENGIRDSVPSAIRFDVINFYQSLLYENNMVCEV